MEKLIITLPDRRLRQKSETVLEINDEIKAIIQNMKQAALDWEKNRHHELSTALAAVQIGVMKRIIIVRQDFNDHTNKNFIALINPEIVKASGRLEIDYEGCLSVPDYYGQVPRQPKIKVKAKDETGQTVYVKAEGFLARTLQHEIDHTLGIPFVDRIKNNRDAFYKLESNGELKEVDYEHEIKSSRILWN
jgi:peptide deformylase